MSDAERIHVGIIGRGRVGRGLAEALAAANDATLTVELHPGRGALPERIAADVLVLAVPDGAIETVARRLLPRLEARLEAPVLLHCAGSLGVEAYGELPVQAPGVVFGALHPLVSFADPKHPPPLTEMRFALAGPPAARRAGTRLAEACGAVPLVRGATGVHGPAYHAAAAMVANGAAGLAWVGVGVLRQLGLGKGEAERALGALLESVGHNVRTLGVPKALTGPVMRGDRETIRRHRKALGRGTEARRAYDALVPVIERCAAAIQRKKK